MHTKTENLGKSGVFTLTPNGGQAGDTIVIELNNGECLLSFNDSWRLIRGSAAKDAAAGGVGGGAQRSG